MAQPIPAGYHTLTPVFTFKDSRKAIDFYKKALDAKEEYVAERPDGKGIMHAALTIGDSNIMLSDEDPGHPAMGTPSASGYFYVYVKDCDAAFKKAVSAGAKATMPVQDMFWGDRNGTVKDPFGCTWTFSTHTRDVSREEMLKAAEEYYAHPAGK